MIGRIVEIAENNRHLAVFYGFMVIKESKTQTEIKRIALDSIVAVIGNAHGLSYSNNLLVALAKEGIPFVLCAANHNAVGMLLPLDDNFEQSRRIDAQIKAKLPVHKRLWSQVVRAKLEQQALLLERLGISCEVLWRLSRSVKSGDPQNLEAQGARYYWQRLFGKNFRRDRHSGAINSLLNYGYTILRATVARAVVAAGLHPSIGLHHANASNAMRLVDDLMEPFRPMVDLAVFKLAQNGVLEVTAEAKRALAKVAYYDMQTQNGTTPVMVCAQKLAVSLAQVYLRERRDLELPLPQLPDELFEIKDEFC